MPFSDRAWGDVERTVQAYGSAEKYCAASLIDLNEPGEDKIAAACKLPIQEPGGAYNLNAMRAATAVLLGARGGVDAPLEAKRKAARKLVRLYREADLEPPEALVRLAG
jgi:hypothetical protein